MMTRRRNAAQEDSEEDKEGEKGEDVDMMLINLYVYALTIQWKGKNQA